MLPYWEYNHSKLQKQEDWVLLRRRVQNLGYSCWDDACRAEFVTGVEEHELVPFVFFVSSKALASSREAE
jgi:hypothetical protein